MNSQEETAMSETKSETKPETKLFNLTAATVTASHVEIEIKSISAAPLTDIVFIEIKFPVILVDPRFSVAIRAARISKKPAGMASVADLVTVGVGLSVWVFNDPNDNIVALRVVNNLNQSTGAALTTPTKIEAGAAFTLRVPLSAQGSRAQVTVPYSYKHGSRRGEPITGSFEVTPAGIGNLTPKVSLTVDRPNSTMLDPGTKVKISWTIEDGVSATLRGPLPGGHSALTLSKDRNSDYRIDQGSLEIYAVGQATYILDAEVRPPGSRRQPNVQVIRTLLLDTKSVDKYASLWVRPDRILPHGHVEIDWAVWGVSKATLRIGEDKSLTLKLTEQDLSRTYQGSGVWSEKALKTDEEVSLVIPDFKPLKEGIRLARWKETAKVKYTGKPIAMAVASPHLALLTSDGLYVARVGHDDGEGLSNPKFSKVSTDAPQAWLALTAFEQGFVVLRQTADYGLQLARYDSAGQMQGTPIDLPEFVQFMVRRPGVNYELAAFGKRVYVVAAIPLPGGEYRAAYSVGFEPREDVKNERLIVRLQNYRLLTLAGSLYALNRSSGHMIRFDLPEDEDDELDIRQVRIAARAANGGRSLIRTGLPVPLADLLVVLDPDEISSPGPLSLFGMMNVGDFTLTSKGSERDSKEVPHDVIYNPQKDHWGQCGQGLSIKPGAVAAFRGGGSERLWVLQPDGTMHTLMETSAKLFAPDYVEKFPAKNLPPPFDARQAVTIRNHSRVNLTMLGDLYSVTGLYEFSSGGLVDIDPPPVTLGQGKAATYKLHYDKAEPPPVKLRFLVHPSRAFLNYYLEVTCSGLDLSSATSVFKRVFTDQSGMVTINEVLGTSVNHPKGSEVIIPPPKRLEELFKLVICNATPYGLASSLSNDTFRPIHYLTLDATTRPFTVFALPPHYDRLGELRFEINIALPDGIEISSGNMAQTSFIRIDPDQSKGLQVKLTKMLKPGDPPLEVSYKDSGADRQATVSARPEIVYVCQIVATA
jgi:hypothetical protein